MRTITLSILAAFALPFILPAQSPIPVIVPANTSTTTQTSSNADSSQAMLKMLQEMKTANDETLRKQALTLEQLDEIETTANQIRIFSRRN